ncbi:hypothetical protein [Microbispora sp. H10836]|uniref:hypothetical protein n=1 Tax=Microbispora sp. H10836 TaxID=2729106 RepID=UPI001B8ACB3A|nr:hypothetical protein [Microbispora sp. H10836]
MSAEAALSGSGNTRKAGGTRVLDVVRDVVAEVAPEELVLVNGLAGLDDDAVMRRLGRGGGRREPLGFGLGEVAVLVTPVVWLVVEETARQMGSAAGEGAAKGTKAVLRRLTRRPAPAVDVPDLTREQLAGVHRQVVETAVKHGLEDSRARLIADAVVGRLALAAPGGDADEPDGPDHGSAPAPD